MKDYISFEQKYIEMFDNAIQQNRECLIDIDELNIPRRIGKTTVLNEISLIYQSQGYNVILWTPYNNEHYATHFIKDIKDVEERFGNKTICIIDEVNLIGKYSREIYNLLLLQDSGINRVGWIRRKVGD